MIPARQRFVQVPGRVVGKSIALPPEQTQDPITNEHRRKHDLYRHTHNRGRWLHKSKEFVRDDSYPDVLSGKKSKQDSEWTPKKGKVYLPPMDPLLCSGPGEDVLDTDNQRRYRVKTGRNALCPCGSGNKYKKCHGKNPQQISARCAAFQEVHVPREQELLVNLTRKKIYAMSWDVLRPFLKHYTGQETQAKSESRLRLAKRDLWAEVERRVQKHGIKQDKSPEDKSPEV